MFPLKNLACKELINDGLIHICVIVCGLAWLS